MKPLVHVLVLAAAALSVGACRTAATERERAAFERGGSFQRRLKSYHLVYSEHRGPVGYLKVYDVQDAGGPTYEWRYVLDRDFEEVGFVDQFGHAYRFERYPAGAMPDPREPLRPRVEMPPDSIGRNVMRMLGIDPATDAVSFPLAKEGDVGTAK